MIKFVIIALLFFAAIAISPILIGEKGYILIAMGDLTIESTVVTASFALIVLFILLLVSLKAFRGGLKFSLGTWNKIAFASKRRGERDYKKGIAAYLLGDYQQAEHLLAKSAEPSQQQSTAYLIAAKAAQEQQLAANAAHYVQLLEHHDESIKNLGIESVLVKLDILMSQQELPKARALLDEYHRHIGSDSRMLALEIQLSILEQRFDNAIDYLSKARKQKDIGAKRLETWQQQAFYGKFQQVITDQSNQALHDYWQGLPRKDKQADIILFTYCQVLAEQQISEPLDKLLLPIMKKGANLALIEQVKTLPINKPESLIAAVQKHLHQDQHSTFWLSCLGHLAVAAKDWPLAERAFVSISANVDIMTPSDKASYAKALLAQEKFQQAAEVLIG